MNRIRFTTVLLAMMGVLHAQEDCPFGKPEPPPKPDIKEIAPGIFQVGTVRMVKETGKISFPVTINMNEGPMEYLVVTGKGKTHESLLVTTAEPFHLQVAMLLLNCKGSEGHLIPEDEKKPIPGEPVDIELHWKEGKKTRMSRIEKFVQRIDGKPVKEGPFIFNGSRVFDGTFLAQRDGSIVSLITDNAAQYNNPRIGRDNDELWLPQRKGLPPLDSNGTLVIHVTPTAKQAELEKRDGKGNIVGQPEKGLWYKRGEKKPFTGRVAGRYKNGQMESERYYENGVQSGTERHWYDNGQKRWEMIYQNGRMISMKAWSIDGKEQIQKP